MSGNRRVRDRAVGEVEQDVEGVVVDGDAAALRERVADAHEDRPRRRLVELRHVDGREPPGERLVERDRRAVLLGRRRPDDRDVAAGEAPASGPGRRPSPPSVRPAPASRWISSKNRMIPGWLASATTWATRSSSWPRYCVPARQRGQRHLDDPRAEERGGDAARDDPLGEALDDRGLADAGRPQQDGVALRAADEDLDHPGRLVLAPDRRAGASPRRRASSGPARAGRGAAWGAGRPPRRPEPRRRSRQRPPAASAGSRRAVGRSSVPRAGPPQRRAGGRPRRCAATRRPAGRCPAGASRRQGRARSGRSRTPWTRAERPRGAGVPSARPRSVDPLALGRRVGFLRGRHRASVPNPSIGEPCVSLARTRSMYACDLSISVESAVTVFCIVSSAATLNVSISSIVA